MPNGGGEPGREGQKVFVPHWLRDQQPGLRQAGFAARVASEKTQGPVQVDPSQVVQEPGEKSADFQARLAKAKQFPGQFRVVAGSEAPQKAPEVPAARTRFRQFERSVAASDATGSELRARLQDPRTNR